MRPFQAQEFTDEWKTYCKNDNDTDRFSRVHTFLTKQPEDKGSKDCWKQAWEDWVQDVLKSIIFSPIGNL